MYFMFCWDMTSESGIVWLYKRFGAGSNKEVEACLPPFNLAGWLMPTGDEWSVSVTQIKEVFFMSWLAGWVTGHVFQGLGTLPLFGYALTCCVMANGAVGGSSRRGLPLWLIFHYVFNQEIVPWLLYITYLFWRLGGIVGWFSYSCFVIVSCFLCAGSAPLPSELVRGMLQLPGEARLLLKLVSLKG